MLRVTAKLCVELPAAPLTVIVHAWISVQVSPAFTKVAVTVSKLAVCVNVTNTALELDHVPLAAFVHVA